MSRLHRSSGLADWLALAAAPVFALMGLATMLAGDSHSALLCSQAGVPPALAGMALMYWLMAGFHLVPWIRRITLRS
ncbi:MAG TPA: hypothetical protein VFO12_12100 [Sphingomicrobium sp.]|nr:hypothetical protein [Sphingomicrobium sp.]